MAHPITIFDLLTPYLPMALSTLFVCLGVTLLIAFFVNRGLEASDGVIPEGRFTLRNLFELLKHLVKEGELELDREDEITSGCLVTHGGEIVHERTRAAVEA